MISSLSARAQIWVRAALIAAAVLAVYFPAIHGGWLWDDNTLIRQNHIIHDADGLAKIWREPINGTELLPVTSSFEWIEWHLFGDDTLGYHLVSLLLHTVSALLVWRVLAQFGLRTAWLGGLLFAIHPVAVESVAWISEQKNALSLPPFLLAISARLNHSHTGRRRDYYLALGWFILAMLAKPTMLMFPTTILLSTWWRHGRIVARDLLMSSPFFAVSLAFGLVAFLLAQTGAVPSTITASVGARLATAGWEMWFLLAKCVVPVHLLPLYPSELVTSPAIADVLPWLALALVLAALWSKRKTWGRHALLGLGFSLLNLVPTFGFIALNATTMVWSLDHLIYIPLIGLVGLAAAGSTLLPLKRAWAVAVVTLVLAALALRSMAYATVFADSRALWTAVLAGNPNSALAHNNLGNWYLNKNQYPEAIDQFHAAIQLQPDYAYAHNGLGNALTLQGRPQDAAAEYRAAIAENPHYAEAHNGLANVLRVMNQLDAARVEAEIALKLQPNDVEALCTLGLIDAAQGNVADAIQQFETAQKLQPNDPRIAAELDSLRARQR